VAATRAMMEQAVSSRGAPKTIGPAARRGGLSGGTYDSIGRRRGWLRAAGVLAMAALLGGCSLTVVPAAGSAGPAVSAATLRARMTDRPAYPASFVASAMSGGSQGLQVFASGGGRMLRSLTRDKDAFAPQVLERARRIYYLADGRGDDCTNILRVPSDGGRPAVVLRLVKATADASPSARTPGCWPMSGRRRPTPRPASGAPRPRRASSPWSTW
jgi:hypothetical protein